MGRTVFRSLAMIRKSRILLLIFAMNLADSSNAALSIFACEPEWASLTRTLGGDRVEVFSATTAHQDPHRIEARPSLIAKVRRADLLVCSGADWRSAGCRCCSARPAIARSCRDRRGISQRRTRSSVLGFPTGSTVRWAMSMHRAIPMFIWIRAG